MLKLADHCPETDGKFKLIRYLGGGTFGKVYES